MQPDIFLVSQNLLVYQNQFSARLSLDGGSTRIIWWGGGLSGMGMCGA